MALNYLDKAAMDAGVYKDKGNDDVVISDDSQSQDSGSPGLFDRISAFLSNAGQAYASADNPGAEIYSQTPYADNLTNEVHDQNMADGQNIYTVLAPDYTPRPLDDSVYTDIPGTPVDLGTLEDESVRNARMQDSADYMAANWPRLYGAGAGAVENGANVVGGIQNALGLGDSTLQNAEQFEKGMQDYRKQWDATYGDSYFLNPNNFANDAGAVVGSSAPILALSAMTPGALVAGGSRALTGALSRAGLGRLAMSKAGQALIADTVRTLPSSSMADSLSEYGGVVHDLMQKGMSEDEARAQAVPIFYKNMALDTAVLPLELGNAKGGKGLITGLLRRNAGENMGKGIAKGTARTGVLSGLSGLTEGYQEGAQNALEDQTKGERDGGWYNPVTWTPEDWKSARAGFVGGALMGIPGNVATAYHPDTKQAELSPEAQTQVQDIKNTLMNDASYGNMDSDTYNSYLELANSGNPELIKLANDSLASWKEKQVISTNSTASTDMTAGEQTGPVNAEMEAEKDRIRQYLNDNTIDQMGGQGNYDWLYNTLNSTDPDEVHKAYQTVVDSTAETQAQEAAQAEQQAESQPAGNISINSDNPFIGYVVKAANDQGIDPKIALSIAARETGGDDVNAINMAPNGGLMQVTEESANDYGVNDLYPDWRDDPEQNAEAGMYILKKKIEEQGGDTWAGVRAYNGAGEAADQYMNQIQQNYDNLGDIGGSSWSDGVSGYDLPTQSDEITAQVETLKPGWKQALPAIGGILNDMGLADGSAISSAGRTSEHNAEVGGAEHSYHINDDERGGGDAVDIVLPEGTTEEQAQAVLDRFKSTGAFKEVLFHDAGSGYHLHLGGYTGGLNGMNGNVDSDMSDIRRQQDAEDRAFDEQEREINDDSRAAMNRIMNDNSVENAFDETQRDTEAAKKQQEETLKTLTSDTQEEHPAQTPENAQNQPQDVPDTTVDATAPIEQQTTITGANTATKAVQQNQPVQTAQGQPIQTPAGTQDPRINKAIHDPAMLNLVTRAMNGDSAAKESAGKLNQNIVDAVQQHIIATALNAHQQRIAKAPAGKTETILSDDVKTEYPAQYKIVSADDITPSNNTDGSVNAFYPQQYQPRDRTRAGMRKQVEDMANKLNPSALGASSNANMGAPVINSQGVVLNGNGRTMALKSVYKGKPKQIKAYKDFLKQNAKSLGIDPATIDSIKNPVLVRQVADDAPVQDIINSKAGGSQMSAGETAKKDADRIKQSTLQLASDSSDLTQESNRKFVNAVLKDVASPEELNTLYTKTGKISQAGITRVKNAVFGKAYGDDFLLTKMSESTDNNIRNVMNSMLAVAPKVAMLNDGMEKGLFYSYPLSDVISGSAKTLISLREQNKPVKFYLEETSLISENENQNSINDVLQFIDRNKRSGKTITAFFNELCNEIELQGHPDQGALIPTENPTMEEVINIAEGKVENNGVQSLFDTGRSEGNQTDQASGRMADRVLQSPSAGTETNAGINGSERKEESAGKTESRPEVAEQSAHETDKGHPTIDANRSQHESIKTSESELEKAKTVKAHYSDKGGGLQGGIKNGVMTIWQKKGGLSKSEWSFNVSIDELEKALNAIGSSANVNATIEKIVKRKYNEATEKWIESSPTEKVKEKRRQLWEEAGGIASISDFGINVVKSLYEKAMGHKPESLYDKWQKQHKVAKGEANEESTESNHVNTEPQQAESKDKESTHAEEGSQGDVQEEVSKFHNVLDDEKSTPKQIIDAYKSVVDKVIANANGSRKNAKIGDKIITDEYQSLTNSKHWNAFVNEDGGRNWHEAATINADAHKTLRAIIKTAGVKAKEAPSSQGIAPYKQAVDDIMDKLAHKKLTPAQAINKLKTIMKDANAARWGEFKAMEAIESKEKLSFDDYKMALDLANDAMKKANDMRLEASRKRKARKTEKELESATEETKSAEQPKEESGFTDEEIKALTDRGFNRWTKKLSNGKVIDRLYIKPEYLGLELTRYKSGNISSATFNGETISNSEARRIEGTKCYVDVATKEVVCDREDLKKAAQEVIDDALSKEKSQEAETDTKYSVREANDQLTRSKEDLKAEIKEAFPNAKEINDEGDRMTFTMPNGSHIVVDMKNEIVLTDKELAQAKKDHHIDDNGNVVVEGYAEARGKDAYIALAQGSREGTGFHEAYHIAEDAVLNDREKAAIKKAIPDAEERADKYAEWVEARKHGRGTAWGKLFQKIKDFAMKMKAILTGAENVHNVFRKIESGEVWERNANGQNGGRRYSVANDEQQTVKPQDIITAINDIVHIYEGSKLTAKEREELKKASKFDPDHKQADRPQATELYDRRAKAGFNRMGYFNMSNYGRILALHLDNVMGLKGNLELTRKSIERQNKNAAEAKMNGVKEEKLSPSQARQRAVMDFGAMMIRNPELARETYPAYSKIFDEGLEQHPDLKEKLDKVIQLNETYQGQTAAERAAGSIAREKEKVQLRKHPKEWLHTHFDEFYTNWVDDKHIFAKVVARAEAELGRKLAYDYDVHKQAQMALNHASGRAKLFLIGGDDAQSTYKRLNEIYSHAITKTVTMKDIMDALNKVSKEDVSKTGAENAYDALGNYLIAMRTEELEKHYHDTYARSAGFDEEGTREIIQNTPESIKKIAQMYWDINTNIVNILQQQGLISKDLAGKLRKYKHYCPMYRDMSDGITDMDEMIASIGMFNNGGGYANINNGIKRIEGGGKRPILDPITSLSQMAVSMISKCERNNVAKTFVKLGQDFAGLGDIVVRDPTLQHADPTAFAFTVWQNGKQVVYRTTPEIYDALTHMDSNSASAVLGIARNIAHTLRTGATISPPFIVRNFLRDTMSATVNSKTGFIPIVDSIRGAWKLHFDKNFSAEYHASGASMSTYMRADADSSRNLTKELLGHKYDSYPVVVKQVRQLIGWAWNKYEKFGNLVEDSTRAGEFMRARKKGMSIDQSGQLARDITLDFSRHGKRGQEVNKYVPFFNATIQGTDKFIRTFKENPMRAILTTTVSIILPSLILWAINHDDDWYKELDENTKYTNWCINLGNGAHLLIPKPQEVGILFGSGVEAVLNQLTGTDPHGMKEWAKQYAEAVTPSLYPAVVRPLIEWMTNYSFWTGRHLIPTGLEKAPSEMQFTSYTSELAKSLGDTWLAKSIKLSPIAIDNWISGWFGSAGRFLANMLNDPINYVKGNSRPPEPAKYWYEMPFIGSFIRQNGQNSEYINRMYEIQKDMNDDYERSDAYKQRKGKKGSSNKPKELKQVDTAVSSVSKINKEIKAIRNDPKKDPDQKRREIDIRREKINALAKKVVTTFDR